MSAKFMHNLPENLTAHLHHNLCAVLPILLYDYNISFYG